MLLALGKSTGFFHVLDKIVAVLLSLSGLQDAESVTGLDMQSAIRFEQHLTLRLEELASVNRGYNDVKESLVLLLVVKLLEVVTQEVDLDVELLEAFE